MKRGWSEPDQRELLRVPCPLPKLPGMAFLECYRFGPCGVMFSRDLFPSGVEWDHISVSCRDRYPTWEEMKVVAARLLPGREVIQWVQLDKAAPDSWLNLHPNCFHLMSRVGERVCPLLDEEEEAEATPWNPDSPLGV